MRDSSRVQSLAIGGRDEFGRQRRASSLETAPEIPSAKIERTVCDWDGVVRAAGLDRRERTYFLRKWRDGDESAGFRLGMSPQQEGAIARGIRRKLQTHAAAVGRCFSTLTDEEILIEEFWLTDQNRARLAGFSRSFEMQIDALNAKLRDARQTKDRLAEKLHQIHLVATEATREVDRLEKEAKEKTVEDLLADRAPGSHNSKAIEAAKSKLATAQQAYGAATEALQRQCAIVEQIESDIAARRHEAFETESEHARAEAEKAVRALSKAAVELRELAAKHNIMDFWSVVFPHDPKDPLAGMEERAHRKTLYERALWLHREVRSFGRAV